MLSEKLKEPGFDIEELIRNMDIVYTDTFDSLEVFLSPEIFTSTIESKATHFLNRVLFHHDNHLDITDSLQAVMEIFPSYMLRRKRKLIVRHTQIWNCDKCLKPIGILGSKYIQDDLVSTSKRFHFLCYDAKSILPFEHGILVGSTLIRIYNTHGKYTAWRSDDLVKNDERILKLPFLEQGQLFWFESHGYNIKGHENEFYQISCV